MYKKNQSWYEEKLSEDLRPAEINKLLSDAEKTDRIEIELETALESGNDE